MSYNATQLGWEKKKEHTFLWFHVTHTALDSVSRAAAEEYNLPLFLVILKLQVNSSFLLFQIDVIGIYLMQQ